MAGVARDRNSGWIFFYRVNFLCWLLFGVCPISMLSQWHVKDPSHSAKSTDGRLHQNMHTPLTQQSRSGLTMPLSRHSVGILSGNELTHNSSGNTWSQSSQLAGPLWTDLGVKSGISVRELITTSKKKKKHRRRMNCQTFSQNAHAGGRSPQEMLCAVATKGNESLRVQCE